MKDAVALDPEISWRQIEIAIDRGEMVGMQEEEMGKDATLVVQAKERYDHPIMTMAILIIVRIQENSQLPITCNPLP